jgi:hypothetical protein
MQNNTLISIVLIVNLSLTIFICDLTAGIYTEEADGSKSFISNGKLKEISEDGGMILDGKSSEIIYYSPESKTYAQSKISDFCKSMAEIMNQMMESMPPEFKELFGMDQEQKQPKVEIVSEGDGGIIAGYKTVKYKVLADGKLHETMWQAMDAALVKEHQSLLGILSEFKKCSNMIKFGDPPIELSSEYLKLMGKGLTLRSIQYEMGQENEVVNTVKVEIKDILDSEFQVPAGYKKVSMTDYFGSQMGNH